jgi:UDP-GlcNAc:undecaprenyl-phosphate/decaprenyl-phosphate GlcNAc-1-phosphate transferase
MTEGGWTYPIVFVASAAISLGLTPLMLKVAVARRLLDHPHGHKGHKSPVPYLGGVAIVVAFVVAVVVASLVSPPVGGRAQLLELLALAVGLTVVGLLDDLWNVNIGLRLGAELSAAVGLWASGVRIDLFRSDAADLALTIVWVVGITNALNLLDNMDGLSAGVASIAATSLFVIAAANGQFLVAGLSIALAGCAIGFLRHNFHPAQIYMGDAGSLFLGFMLAALAIKLRFDAPTNVTFFVPVLVLGVPVFDTVLVTVMRILNHRSPLSGGRDHTSHRLVAVGIPVPVAVGLIYAATIALGWAALVMSRLDPNTAYLLMGLIGAITVFGGILLASVPVYSASGRTLLLARDTGPDEIDADETARRASTSA